MTKLIGILAATLMLLTAIPDADAAQITRSRTLERSTMNQHSMRPTSHTASRSERTHKGRVSSDKSNANKSTRTKDTSTKDVGKKDLTTKDTNTGARDIKSSSSAAREAKTPITFDRKPAGVAHNPEHLEGTTGDRADHKSVLVERDGHYLKRSYYSGLGAGVLTWYWYETALDDTDPVIPLLPYVMTCPEVSDDCRLTEKKSSSPERLKNPDAVIAGFSEWWNNITGTCAVNAVPEPGSIPATVLINCTAVGQTTPCNGVCKLYTITGDKDTFPKRLLSGNQSAYKCECESP